MSFGRRNPLSLLEQAKNILLPRSGIGRVMRYIKLRLQRLPGTPHVIALGLSCGVFVSFTPLIGFHFLIGGLIAYLIGGSIIASAIGTFVGNPWTFPLIWLSTFRLGYIMMGREHDASVVQGTLQPDQLIMSTEPGVWERIIDVLLPMLVGSLPIGIAAGIVCYLIMRPLIATYQKRRWARISARISRDRAAMKEEAND